MAVSIPKKKSKKSKKIEFEERSFPDSFLYKLLNKIPAALLLLFIIFLWSSSTTIISGSIVHVCVTSRKLNNLYCLSAGAQPGNYTIPLPLINNVTDQQTPLTTSKLSLNVTQKNPISDLKSPSKNLVAEENPKLTHSVTPKNPISDIKSPSKNLAAEENPKLTLNVTQKNPVSSLKSPSTPADNKRVISIPSTPASVIRDSVDISSKDQVSDGGSSKNASVSSPSTSFSPFTNPVLRRGIDKAKAEELANARKDVEGQLLVLRSYIAKSKPSDCDGRGIYVYELPPKFNKELFTQCKEMLEWLDFCSYLTNNAMGEPILELGKGWYNTHQYSLEPIFHSLVLNHPCRVHKVEEAKLFYVPFYGGLDILRWHFKHNVTNDMKDTLSKEMVQWLKLQKPWKRNFGLDHVFVLGKISWDFRRYENNTWGTRLLELDELQNPMKLLIERQPWHINDVGVPHPTYFHPSTDEDIISWQTKIREVRRKNLISFAGASRKASESIRSTLIEQCTSSSNKTCKFFDCREQACTNPAPVVKLFMESEFCLQPPGDSPTRKSVFDSLVAGCIPVVFDPFTAHYQYPWHLPEDYRKYSVYIDQEEVRMSEVNVVERLMKIPLKERQEMRKYIIDELMPKLVYPNPNGKLNKFEDAFSIAMNNLLERAVSRLP